MRFSDNSDLKSEILAWVLFGLGIVILWVRFDFVVAVSVAFIVVAMVIVICNYVRALHIMGVELTRKIHDKLG